VLSCMHVVSMCLLQAGSRLLIVVIAVTLSYRSRLSLCAHSRCALFGDACDHRQRFCESLRCHIACYACMNANCSIDKTPTDKADTIEVEVLIF